MDDSSSSTEVEDYDFKPSGERWAPLGANDADDDHTFCFPSDFESYGDDGGRLRELEEQLETLNSSLIALTSHFAQVQFRLKQIVDAPLDEKERLLKDLEAYAFRGVPELQTHEKRHALFPPQFQHDPTLEDKVIAQRAKQKKLISQLKSQLEDLEHYAYETGEAGLPQSVLIERQKVIIDQLKGRLNLNVDDMDRLTEDDLKTQVDCAISQLVNPLKMKEQLVTQLKTQISDLERFIEFLQGESEGDAEAQECTCKCPVHGQNASSSTKHSHCHGSFSDHSKINMSSEEEIRAKTFNIIKKIAELLHMFTVAQFGCGSDHFRKNTLKKTMKANHWGDLRANLELAVDYVMQLASSQNTPVDSDYTSDSEDTPAILCNEKLTTAVRKNLALSIRDLVQHGLMPVGQSSSLVPFIGCFPTRSNAVNTNMHAWELILKYYAMKNGEKYNSTPARKLSLSFNLDIVGGTAISNKQNLLSTIGNILHSHSKYKRSYDSHFKAFVCAGLNSKKLVPWMRLIFRCQPLIEQYYQSWSYVSRTGFEDSFQSLDKLTQFNFDLPVDLAVRQFQNIKDAF
ncbi:RUN domain-containing protein 1 isoform X1 [Ischnura elegans]|uniref:RUN domain-containing protein 1 isoform X1 n=1 Tax=Ischnura elegans TaxID=197161 RepID=UPI001ED8681C|nr:RUN domain-containing protein 1 isoform X1 [Ischnura elegans]